MGAYTHTEALLNAHTHLHLKKSYPTSKKYNLLSNESFTKDNIAWKHVQNWSVLV